MVGDLFFGLNTDATSGRKVRYPNPRREDSGYTQSVTAKEKR